jgi:DNA-binding NtrC family response regulator
MLVGRQEGISQRMARIIVIDDDEQILSLLRAVLEQAGHQVATAANGDEGIRFYRAQKADVIITDILMPVKEGIGTIYELRRLDSDVKIIAMSGGGGYGTTDHYMDMARKIGASRTFSKPFDVNQMMETVKELLLRADRRVERYGLRRSNSTRRRRIIDFEAVFRE